VRTCSCCKNWSCSDSFVLLFGGLILPVDKVPEDKVDQQAWMLALGAAW